MGTGYTRNDTPNNIADGNVINASDLDGEFDAIQSAFNGTTGHSHDGTTGEGPQIATGGLADNAVTTAKITDANVTTAKIADSNVTTAKIANSNVTLAKMAANSVDSDQYVDGSIDRVHLAADIVDGTKIADDSINSEHYVDGSIDTAHIGNLQVTTAKIAADAIDGTKIADNAIDSEHYTDGSIDRVHLAADIVDGTKIADDSIDSEHYVDGSIDTAHIANDAVTGDKLANNIQIAGTLGVTGETTLTTHLNMGDNDTIKLGAGSDLQIYHDGSNSYVEDTATGSLILKGANVLVNDSSDNNILKANDGGSAVLFYAGANKLATTSTGIDVTGTAVTDGLTVAGNLSVDGGTIKLDGNYPTGTNNIALGNSALSGGSLSGGFNVAIANNALSSNTSGGSNIAIGSAALQSNTTADKNIGIGESNLSSNTTGGSNVSVGDDAMYANTTGSNNVAIGGDALENNTTASNNTAVGYQALYANTTGTENVAVGQIALATNTTGVQNTAVGRNALNAVTTADSNTAIGQGAGRLITTGAKNTIIGRYNGNEGGLDIRTSSNYIVLSDGDGNPRAFYDNSVIGAWVFSNASVGTGYWPSGASSSGTNVVSLNTSSGYITASGNALGVVYLDRNASDGDLIRFHQAGTLEGTISVSGTTVSYNGGHLSRWSQLADNTRDESIVKGTVMTNLDAMAEWTDEEGNPEDNEQLNKMAVSSVEGDINVAGVFVNWDNDDDYSNDMNVAMTGDMVIRIAQGTTVARGDLLMSAGDGTAKPQGDDIVRSKTIAKVTSTNVSHTYDDGTYLVPCVLMAC